MIVRRMTAWVDCVGFEVLEWERSKPIFSVCGREGERNRTDIRVSAVAYTSFFLVAESADRL